MRILSNLCSCSSDLRCMTGQKPTQHLLMLGRLGVRDRPASYEVRFFSRSDVDNSPGSSGIQGLKLGERPVTLLAVLVPYDVRRNGRRASFERFGGVLCPAIPGAVADLRSSVGLLSMMDWMDCLAGLSAGERLRGRFQSLTCSHDPPRMFTSNTVVLRKSSGV